MVTDTQGLIGPEGDVDLVIRTDPITADLIRARAQALGLTPDELVSRLIARCASECAQGALRLDDDE